MNEKRWLYNKFRLQKQFCDAVIRVDGTEFHMHKIILCNCSSFFSSLFTQWSSSDTQLFDIPHVSPEMMKLFIEFAYTGCVPVTPGNVKELFIAANRFDVTGILEACSELLEQHLDPLNCIGIWWFADIYYYPELKQKAFLFTLAHFEAVAATSEEFLQLSVQDLAKILDSDKLTVKKEDTVFEAIIRWITYAPDERRDCISLLLAKVRLVYLSPKYIMETVNNTAVVRMSKHCRRMLLGAMKTMLNLNTKKFFNCNYFHPVAPRLPREILLAMGGRNGDRSTNCIEAYNVCAGHWINVHQQEAGPRAYHGTAFISGSVYWIGGSDGVTQYSSVHKFELSTRTWQEVGPMHSIRCFVSVAVMDGYIYALGGFDGRDQLHTAERYEPQTNQWTMIASMQDKRSHASCTSLRGKIYICGGFNGSKSLSTAECYNPGTDQWTLITSMGTRRSGIGVIAYSSYVFAVGGFDGTTRLCTAEAYNPQTNTWHDVSSMLTPRSNFGIAVMDGRLFAVGGNTGVDPTHDVESFDAETGEWSEVRSMTMTRSHLSCCVVYGLNNMADYATLRYSHPTSSEKGDEADF